MGGWAERVRGWRVKGVGGVEDGTVPMVGSYLGGGLVLVCVCACRRDEGGGLTRVSTGFVRGGA